MSSLQPRPSKGTPDPRQVLQIGLGLFVLSICWYFLSQKTAAPAPKIPSEIQRRLDAVEAYKKDPSNNSYQYDTDRIPMPLSGGQENALPTDTPPH